MKKDFKIINKFGFIYKKERYILTKVVQNLTLNTCKECALLPSEMDEICNEIAGNHCNAIYPDKELQRDKKIQYVYKKEK